MTTTDTLTEQLSDLIDAANMLGFDAAIYSDTIAERAFIVVDQLEATTALVATQSAVAWAVIDAARDVIAVLRDELRAERRRT